MMRTPRSAWIRQKCELYFNCLILKRNVMTSTRKLFIFMSVVFLLGIIPVCGMAQRPDGRNGEEVICRGEVAHTSGPMVTVGQQAPDFKAVNAELKEVSLSDFKGKRVILNVFPSLDTSTCAASVRQFNAQASELDNVVVLCLSMDLPFAQSRFCTTEGLKDVVPLSVFRSRGFMKGYGLRLADGPLKGLMARAVIVVDEGGKVVYTQLVHNISDEPDYEAALKAVN